VKRFVVDASVAIKWVVQEPDTPHALQLAADNHLVAPDLMLAEFANVLSTKIRQGEFNLGSIDRAVEVLQSARIAFRPIESLLPMAIRLAHQLRHPAYDCFYLALAIAEGCQLITSDLRFQRKTAACGDPNLENACKSLVDWALDA
jgi:predicted nucleic acid-binding protein